MKSLVAHLKRMNSARKALCARSHISLYPMARWQQDTYAEHATLPLHAHAQEANLPIHHLPVSSFCAFHYYPDL